MQNNPDKKVCRLEGKRRRSLLTEGEREAAEQQIRKLIIDSDVYRSAERILIYASYQDEVSTWELMEEAIRDKKEVYCPKTVAEGSEKRLDFYRIFSVDDLSAGFRGIREPAENAENLYRADCLEEHRDLILIPGCAFDREGHRLGYGGGFYDRFLAKHRELLKMALCFSCQILDSVPQEETDIRPDYLVTENERIRLLWI